ncbi:MAG: peptidoglycan DD-metalloendopeptidase family protein [Gemmatimonadota bacterium]
MRRMINNSNHLRDRSQRTGNSGRAGLALAMVILCLGSAGCGVEEFLMEPFRGETPRERYGEALDRAGLGESLLVREWHRAGERALLGAVEVSAPLVEENWIAPDEPTALGYRLDLRRGERVQVEVRAEHTVQRVFIELYRDRPDDEDDDPLLVDWAADFETGFVYDARATGSYLLRVQPELLGGGPLEVEIRVGASVAFPVQDRSTANVMSFFGDIRDGGARDHHGVDIFAPRGTPVLAATAGTAYRVDVTARGGKVVWVRDGSGEIRSYYAHLDAQLVEEGEEVSVGDTLGLVGNTGNAITTPPHLHFGIYVRRGGAVDPWPFLHEPPGEPPRLDVPREAFNETFRIALERIPLRAGPFASATELAELPRELSVRVIGGTGRWFRVRTAAGGEGYIAVDAVLPLDRELDPETRLAFAFQ